MFEQMHCQNYQWYELMCFWIYISYATIEKRKLFAFLTVLHFLSLHDLVSYQLYFIRMSPFSANVTKLHFGSCCCASTTLYLLSKICLFSWLSDEIQWRCLICFNFKSDRISLYHSFNDRGRKCLPLVVLYQYYVIYSWKASMLNVFT